MQQQHRTLDCENDIFVSVVTPFYNSELYLRECIESILHQTHENFEYILVNNVSNDHSLEIAREYAQTDSRIRIVTNSRFLGQVDNYNSALRMISKESKYCKVVQADDWIYPECLSKMVSVGEKHPTVGLIGSYRLEGANLAGSGLSNDVEFVAGKDMARLHLLNDLIIFGSPTSVMYRSDLVRSRHAFYATGRYHEDTDICFDLLRISDFAFVHQILSFTRTDNNSITSATSAFDTGALDFYLRTAMHGRDFLSPDEFASKMRRARGTYYRDLARGLIQGKGREYWQYHRTGLIGANQPVPRLALIPYFFSVLLDLALNPKNTVSSIIRRLRSKRKDL